MGFFEWIGIIVVAVILLGAAGATYAYRRKIKAELNRAKNRGA